DPNRGGCRPHHVRGLLRGAPPAAGARARRDGGRGRDRLTDPAHAVALVHPLLITIISSVIIAGMRTDRRLAAVAGMAAASVLVLAGCSSSGADASDGRIAVVASTDVYGQLVEQIGGERV